jgi:hypothetical protein
MMAPRPQQSCNKYQEEQAFDNPISRLRCDIANSFPLRNGDIEYPAILTQRFADFLTNPAA